MKTALLREHIDRYKKGLAADPETFARDAGERRERREYYQSWSAERLNGMSEDDLYDYVSQLWAMLIWGNKHYVVDKLIEQHGLDQVRTELSHLLWGDSSVAQRWDRFRSKIKGMGPAMMSELLCYTHPDECMLWNRRAYVAFDYLGVEKLPRYNYQFTGKRYAELSEVAKQIGQAMEEKGVTDVDLLTVDYFIWHELQVKENLSQMHKKAASEVEEVELEKTDTSTSEFIHDEVRDKLAEIGTWLGLRARTEVKVADGSKVDTVWEQTIGNMPLSACNTVF